MQNENDYLGDSGFGDDIFNLTIEPDIQKEASGQPNARKIHSTPSQRISDHSRPVNEDHELLDKNSSEAVTNEGHQIQTVTLPKSVTVPPIEELNEELNQIDITPALIVERNRQHSNPIQPDDEQSGDIEDDLERNRQQQNLIENNEQQMHGEQSDDIDSDSERNLHRRDQMDQNTQQINDEQGHNVDDLEINNQPLDPIQRDAQDNDDEQLNDIGNGFQRNNQGLDQIQQDAQQDDDERSDVSDDDVPPDPLAHLPQNPDLIPVAFRGLNILDEVRHNGKPYVSVSFVIHVKNVVSKLCTIL